jgi:hypothetical protein
MPIDIAAKATEVRKRLQALQKSSPGYLDMQRIMTRYAIERALYRLGTTRHASRFVLKGAMLLSVYIPDATRSTVDADFLLIGRFTKEKLKGIIVEVCDVECDDRSAHFVRWRHPLPARRPR